MKEISRPVVKKDHAEKMSGRAVYVADLNTTGMLHGKFVRSPLARARVLAVRPPIMPEGYFTVDKNDLPGPNHVRVMEDDHPIYAGDTVEFVGDVVLMVVGPDEAEAERLAAATQVDYEPLPPCLDVMESDTLLFDYRYGHGDTQKAFEKADFVYEEDFETGYQEQAYLETQGLIGEYHDGKLTIRGSMQCPYYIHGSLLGVMNCAPDKVQIVQETTGGGFGGKEAYPSILAAQVGVAARKANGKPVRVIYGRREDMAFTSKRHPSRCHYKVAVKNKTITALEADVTYDPGAYTTLSGLVLQRGIFAAPNCYLTPALEVRGHAPKTNTVPNGAFRGFGAPQTVFAMETLMNHLAEKLGEDPLDFKMRHMAKQGDMTSTGGRYHFPVPLPAMIQRVDEAVSYRKKRAEYAKPQTGRYRRGIGMAIWFHGAGYTGSGERDFVKAVTKLQKTADGYVKVLVSNTDMGQGLKTTLCKIVAQELNLPLDNILIDNPDTDLVPNSGPTVASRSLMIVGELLRRAAIKLRGVWKEGEAQEVTEHYSEPGFMIPFDMDTFEGDAYPTQDWAVCTVELEVDRLTGCHKILDAFGCFDVGTPIDMNIIVGQMEGGFMQGLGYSSMEKMENTPEGGIRHTSFTDYIIPTAMDVPHLEAEMYVEEFPYGPYGAKGAGELPLVGIPPAYIEALEQALGGAKLCKAPFGPEDTLKALREVKA